jgi:hypothetical protein
VLEQHGVHLGREDVHAARDDHLGGAPGQEQVAVLVEVAHVAQREEAAAVGGVGLLAVPEVLEATGLGRLDVDRPHPVGRHALAVVVPDLDHGPGRRAADAARLAQPVLGADEGAAAFGRGVVLPDDRAEPLDDRALDGNRRRGGAVQHVAQRRGVVASLHLVGQREQSVEHRRHHVRVRDAVLLDEAQRLLRLPAVHQRHADASVEWQRQIEGERRGVVERPGAQAQVVARAKGRARDHLRAETAGGRRLLAVDALGPAGRARGVEHGAADLGILEVVARLGREQGVVGLEARNLAPARQPHLRLRSPLGGTGDDVGEAGVGDEGACLAVVDDVGDLVRLQVPVDAGQPQAGAQGGAPGLGELGAVRAEQRDCVSRLEPAGA